MQLNIKKYKIIDIVLKTLILECSMGLIISRVV